MAYDAELEYKPSYQENKESLLEVLNKTNKEDHKHIYGAKIIPIKSL
jgi:hypothetical protein